MMNNNEIRREVLLELSPPSLPSSTSIPNYSSQSGGASGIRRRRRRSLVYHSNNTKSRLVEPPHPRNKLKISNDQDLENFSVAATLGSSLSSSGGDDDDDDDDVWGSDDDDDNDNVYVDDDNDDDVYMTSSGGGAGGLDDDEEKHGNKNAIIKFLALMEWITLFCMVGLLISSLCINKLKHCYIWGLNIWKWCILILVVFCGHLVTKWLMDLLEFFVRKKFLFKKKVLYFIYGVKTSVRVFLWLGLILLTWILLTNNKRSSSPSSRRVLNHFSRGIGCSLLGAVLWMVKDFFIKLLASSFHVKTFFDRIQDSFFHQYVLQVLSCSSTSLHLPNAINNDDNKGMLKIKKSNKMKKKKKSGEEEEEVIRVDKLNKVKKEKVSAWTMGGLMKTISSSGVVAHKEIRSEFDAKIAAKHIFKKVAKTSNDYIEEQDLLQFMAEEEVDRVLMMFEEAAETGKIKKSDFKRWVVKVYKERNYLKYSLKDSKTAIGELNKIITTCLIVIIIIVWLILMGIISTRVLVFISSQLLLVTFVFGDSAKTLFECLIFVFVTHPFDVGDICVIDGVQMTVEEMNILSTSFLRYDNEMIYYPNSVLAKKPISNFNRSPEMGDSVEFAVDFSTSVQTIAALKARIKKYLESKPRYWRAGHSVTITAIEDMNKLKMSLCVTHTVNFQCPERGHRRSELLLELKTIFEDLKIKYHFLPQELQVHLTSNSAQTSIITSSSSS